MVLRVMPVASATSDIVIFRPNSFSFSFHKENRSILTAICSPSLPFCLTGLTFTQKYGIITSARFLSGSTIKSGFKAYFGQYTCPDCMFTQGPGSLREQSRGNSISQSGRSGRKSSPFKPPLNTVVTQRVILCLSKIYLILCILHKWLCTSWDTSASHNPKLRQLNNSNQGRFYFTPMGVFVES